MLRNAKIITCSVLVALHCCTSVASAQEQGDVIYVLGYPNDQLVNEPGLSETIISREQLEKYGSAPLTEVLSDISYLFIDNNAGRGSFNGISFRGSDPNFIQFRIDGIVVNDATNTRGGAFDFGSLSALVIERIEIISNSSSALYGSQALAGVINIVTRQADSGFEAVLGFDSHGGYTYSAMLASNSLALSFISERPGTSISGSLHESTQLNLKGSWLLSDRQELNISARAQESVNEAFPDDSGGFIFAFNRELERRESDARQLGLHYIFTLNSGSKIEVNTSAYSRGEERVTPAIAPGQRDPFGFPRVDSRTTYNKALTEIRYLGVERTRWNWLAGFSWENEKGKQDGELDFSAFALPSNFTLERDNISASALLSGRLGNNVKLSFGGRVERFDETTVFSPRVNGEIIIDNNQKLIASWGEGFKGASFYALGDPLIGSADLDDELSESFEFGHRWASESWQLRHTAYSTEFSNLIDFDSGPPPRLLNRSKVKTQGIDSEIRVNINPKWTIDLNQSYVKTKASTVLRNRPKYRAYIGVNYSWSDRISIWARGRYTSRRLDSSIATGDRYLDSHQLLNIGGRWALGSAWTLTANLQNALKEQFQQSIGNVLEDHTLLIQLRYSHDSERH